MRKSKYSDEKIAAIIAAYQSGMSLEEVAKSCNVSSDSNVWHILKKYKIPLRMQNYPTRRPYNGVSYRSYYECAFAMLLDALNIKFQFEPKKFRLGGNSSYTPDFFLPDLNIYIEIKGYERGTQAQRRATVVSKYGIQLIVLGKSELTSIGAF